MAHTARSKEQTRETFDSAAELERKTDKLAQLVTESRHIIAFTGAGISTSCGIPDYRSALDTCLDVGPGTWSLAAAKQKRAKEFTPPLKAIPSSTHMALVQLQRVGKLAQVVSQNTDGLHRRSGLPRSAVSELHGNSNLEYCIECGREYMRDYRTRGKDPAVRGGKGPLFHLTGRLCSCGGKLRDSIVNFTENLPDLPLHTAQTHGAKADLCIVLGSSCTVTPAADIPPMAKKMVIVNLQPTPLDQKSSMVLKIHAKTDQVMEMLMRKIAQPIPRFVLGRQIEVAVANQLEQSATGTTCISTVTVRGVDTCTDTGSVVPYSLFRRVNVQVPDKAVGVQFQSVGAESVSVSECESKSCVVSTATADGISLVANKRGRYRLDKDPASLRVAYQFPSQPTEAASQAGGQVQIRFPEPLRARVLFNGRYGENTSPLDLEIRLPPVPISSSVTTHSHRQLFACQFDVQQPHWDWHHVVTTEHRAPDSTSEGSASTTTAGRGCCIG